MKKHSKSNKEKPKSSFLAFLKKRAPIYLGIIALFIIFVIPSLTEKNLENSLPEDFAENEKQVLEFLKSYKGINDQGLTIIEAVSEQIETQYPDEKIYEHKETKIDLLISKQNDSSSNYDVHLTFESYKGALDYTWDVNTDTKEIQGTNEEGKKLIRLVDFYN